MMLVRRGESYPCIVIMHRSRFGMVVPGVKFSSKHQEYQLQRAAVMDTQISVQSRAFCDDNIGNMALENPGSPP